jgi:hypothetical protein
MRCLLDRFAGKATTVLLVRLQGEAATEFGVRPSEAARVAAKTQIDSGKRR